MLYHHTYYYEIKKEDAYVGKKLTKLSPSSCEHVITAKMETLRSFIASLNPDHILYKHSD